MFVTAVYITLCCCWEGWIIADEAERHDGGGTLGCSHHISVGYTHTPLPLAFEA